MVTLGLPNGNDGKPMAAQVGAGGGFIPKGAKNVEVAKDLMKYWMQPKIMNANLKAGLGRWVPAIPQVVKDDPWWLDPADPHRAAYVREAVSGRRFRPTRDSIPPGARSTPSSSGGRRMPMSSRTA